MGVIEILLITFLILWIIIGVGAALVLLRFHWIVKRLENIVSNVVAGLNDLSSAFRNVATNKEAIVGGVTLLALIKRFFNRKKQKES